MLTERQRFASSYDVHVNPTATRHFPEVEMANCYDPMNR